MFSFLSRNKVKSIDVNELDGNLIKNKLIDIREPHETKLGTIKGSKKVPMNTLLKYPDKYLNKEDEYYIMCQSGMRSSRTSKGLSKLGFKVVNVKGEFRSYIEKGAKR